MSIGRANFWIEIRERKPKEMMGLCRNYASLRRLTVAAENHLRVIEEGNQ